MSSKHTPMRWALFDQNGFRICGGFLTKRDALQSLPPSERRWYKVAHDGPAPARHAMTGEADLIRHKAGDALTLLRCR